MNFAASNTDTRTSEFELRLAGMFGRDVRDGPWGAQEPQKIGVSSKACLISNGGDTSIAGWRTRSPAEDNKPDYKYLSYFWSITSIH